MDGDAWESGLVACCAMHGGGTPLALCAFGWAVWVVWFGLGAFALVNSRMVTKTVSSRGVEFSRARCFPHHILCVQKTAAAQGSRERLMLEGGPLDERIDTLLGRVGKARCPDVMPGLIARGLRGS